jgi:hypothetical protein
LACRVRPGARSSAGRRVLWHHVMTYLAFFEDTERKGKAFENLVRFPRKKGGSLIWPLSFLTIEPDSASAGRMRV